MARCQQILCVLSVVALLAGCGGAASPDTAAANSQTEDAVDASLMNAAGSAEQNHDYKGAVQHLTTLYQRRSNDRQIALALARNLRFSGQAQAAADILQSVLGRIPEDTDLLIELGKDYLAADRVNLAEKYLEKAKIAVPKRWEVYSTLAVVLDMQGRNDLAQQAYAQADALSPDNPTILNNMALSQALSGHLAQALITMNRAADLPNATAQTRQNLALLLALKGDAALAGKLVAHDLSPDTAKSNIEILKALAAATKAQ